MSSSKGKGGASDKVIPKVEVPGFDVAAYAGAYKGHTKVTRLIFVAERAVGLEQAALKLALTELKTNTKNARLYKDVCDMVGDSLGPEFAYDASWVQATDKANAAEQDALDHALNEAKGQLVKEGIREGHSKLGDTFYARGDLNSALKCYVRTRDYCTTSQHVVDMCLNVIKVSIEMNNFAHVMNYVTKAEQAPDGCDQVVRAKLRVCAGLASLENKKYRQAAQSFATCPPHAADHFADIVSPQDIATYGSLCALASYSRSEIAALLQTSNFSASAVLVPEVGQLVRDFYSSKYADCLAALDRLKPRMQVDIHLHDHIALLCKKIRQRAIVQYFRPYNTVNITIMAEAFNVSADELERELAALIVQDAIQARIDSFNKILIAKQVDQRAQTFKKAISMGEEYDQAAKSMLLRMDLAKAEFMVKPPRRGKGGLDYKEG